jgi:hypothetical protein
MHPVSDEQSEFAALHGGAVAPAEGGGKRSEKDAGRGLTARTARAIVALFLLAFVTAGLSLLLTARYVNAQQAAQRRQGQVAVHAICTTLGRLAALTPPPGAAKANPSRAYEQELHATLDQLGPDLGCGRNAPGKDSP